MIFRIFIVLALLANVYFGYQIYALAQARHALGNVPAAYSFGPADADVTIVEFLDYTCSHCRDIAPVIREAVERDGRVRFIARPYPSSAPGAVKYGQLVYAAGRQGKFYEMHNLLMEDFRIMDDRRKAEMARQLGLDLQKLDADMESEHVQDQLKENIWLMMFFYSKSLPHFVINGWMEYSPATAVPTVDDFLKIFQEARGPL